MINLLFLLVGLVIGWLGAERYFAMMTHEDHGFEELFAQNPHPEIFKKDGTIDRSEYTCLTFDLGYDPEEFNPEDIETID